MAKRLFLQQRFPLIPQGRCQWACPVLYQYGTCILKITLSCDIINYFLLCSLEFTRKGYILFNKHWFSAYSLLPAYTQMLKKSLEEGKNESNAQKMLWTKLSPSCISYVKVLISRTSSVTLFGNKHLKEVILVTRKLLEWTRSQSKWGPYKKGNFGHSTDIKNVHTFRIGHVRYRVGDYSQAKDRDVTKSKFCQQLDLGLQLQKCDKISAVLSHPAVTF